MKYGQCLLAILSSIVCFSPGVAAEEQLAPLIPRVEIFSAAARNLVKISPDGRQLSWLANSGDFVNLHIAPIDAPDDSEPVFKQSDAVSVVSYEWAYTKEHLLFSSDRNGAVHLFVLDLATNEKRDLTPGETSNVRIERLSPDLKTEVLVSAGGSEFYRIDVETGGKTKVVENTDEFSGLLFDNRLRPAVARKQTPDGGFDLYTRNETGAWRKFLEVPWQNARDSRAYSVDRKGETLFMVDNLTTDKAVLKAYDLKTGKAKVLLKDERADLSLVPMVNPVSADVESATAYYGDQRRHYLDRKVRKDFEYLQTKHAGDVGIAGRSLDDRKWLIVYLNGGPLRYYSFDRKTRTVSFLCSSHPELEKYELARREQAEITTRDGLKFPAHLYLPADVQRGRNGKLTRRLPLLIFVHGGPTVAYPWNSFFTNRIFQLLTNRGYAVLRVEFRGAGGFGKTIADAGNLEWGRKMHDDILDAADWAVETGIAERRRIGIFGWSYGGYATLAALTFTPERFACGIALYPVSDLKALLEEAPAFWRIKLGDERTPEGANRLRESSPLFHVENIERPLLITHGGRDQTAAPYHSNVFVDAMQKAGKPVIYLYYPDELHDYRQDQNWISFFAVAERFLAENLGGRFEPVGGDLDDVAFEVKAGRDLIPGLSAFEGPYGRGLAHAERPEATGVGACDAPRVIVSCPE